MLFHNQKVGKKGEEFVAKFLKENGYSIICKNYKTFFGEIDIIAENNEKILFVEVKSRQKKICYLKSIINNIKQNKIIKTAEHYISKHGYLAKIYRFDVAFVYSSQTHENSIEYIENAFFPKSSMV